MPPYIVQLSIPYAEATFFFYCHSKYSQQMRSPVEHKVRLGFGAAFILLLVSFLFSTYTANELLYHTKWVQRTNSILHNLESMHSEIKDLEAAFRGYLVTHNNNLLSKYTQSFTHVDSLYRELQKETIYDKVQKKRLEDLGGLIQDEYAVISEGVSTYVRHDNQVIKDSTRSVINKETAIMEKIGQNITDMRVSEKALLQIRSQRLFHSSGAMKAFNITTLIIALLLAIYSLLVFNKENAAKKIAHMQMLSYATELEKRVAELKKANAELFRLRSIEKFAATGRIARMIAHEVRNPLTNINLSCEQLKEFATEDNYANDLLHTILRNSQRINQLISDLLNSTKMQELQFGNVSINQLLDEALETAMDRIQLKGIRVQKQYTPDICDVKVDAEKMKIAFLNIILNAVEAMEDGKGILLLKTETRNNQCVVTISDNGKGIDEESLNKIFEPYFTGKTKGAGLGLTNTQNIILTHKGNIEVESEVGKGTSFIITLDFAPANG